MTQYEVFVTLTVLSVFVALCANVYASYQSGIRGGDWFDFRMNSTIFALVWFLIVPVVIGWLLIYKIPVKFGERAARKRIVKPVTSTGPATYRTSPCRECGK